MYRIRSLSGQGVPDAHGVVVGGAEEVVAGRQAPAHGVDGGGVRVDDADQRAKDLVPDVDLSVLAAADDEALARAAEGALEHVPVLTVAAIGLHNAAVVQIPQTDNGVTPSHAHKHLVVQRAASHDGDGGVLREGRQLPEADEVQHVQ
ncbi:protein translocation protein SEC63 [Babesia caballi]|uniref:Protein translocation protein SEC63 n=1 Tax=Babesia caballi TaxID=5871 RepID=A0AAV4LXC5_BABCB|nr:protein translocation protein SEC63 [Babesia caballi]